jgi:hypothetical protein
MKKKSLSPFYQCVIIALFFILPHISYAQKAYNIKCEQIFFYIKNYWTKDSLGENGLRLLTATLLKDCSNDVIIGKNWKEIELNFGKPTKMLMENKNIIYRYQLTNWADPYFLDIEVDFDDKVIKYLIWRNDG